MNEYEALVEEVHAIIVEAVFNSRNELIKGYWEVGQTVRQFKKGEVTELLQDLAVDLGKSERTLWYAVQFYDKFPRLEMIDQLPEQKNLSWNKIITKYLTDGKKEKKEPESRCPKCRYKGKSLEFRI